MDAQLYLRVRGRVLGPYDQEKLQSLVRRGQLSRMHEVSTDGATWVRASTYAELFIAVPVKLVAPEMQAAAPPTAQARGNDAVMPMADDTVAAPGPAAASSAGRRWHYEYLGGQQGPIDEAGLRQMLATGQLDANALVWNDSMTNWAAASQVPGLVPVAAPRAGGHGNQRVGASDQELESLCKAARASRPWVMFLAITAFVYAGLCILGGFLEVVLGAKTGSPVLVAQGMFAIIFGAVNATGAILLQRYAARLASLAYSRSLTVLESAMDRLKIFWTFSCIVLIVALAFAGVVAILVFSLGVGLPHF